MRKYRCYHNKDMGFCAMLKCDGFWQQVSFWYTSIGRLNAYWGKKNGIIFTDTKTIIEY